VVVVVEVEVVVVVVKVVGVVGKRVRKHSPDQN
jgi:hypothetical protein